jgi:hypothetical protein
MAAADFLRDGSIKSPDWSRFRFDHGGIYRRLINGRGRAASLAGPAQVDANRAKTLARPARPYRGVRGHGFHAGIFFSCPAKQPNRLAANVDKPIPEPGEPRQRKQLGLYHHVAARREAG